MSVLNRIAYFQNRRDEGLNRELAKELAAARDKEGIHEIALNLWHENLSVQSDCIKVLYEIGYLNPELIAIYVYDFLKLLQSRHNRLVWGGMVALSTIAALQAEAIYRHRDEVKHAMETGSVITVDSAVKTLASVAAHGREYGRELFPYLLQHLRTCRPKDVPQHAQSTLVAVDDYNSRQFVRVLERRLADLSSTQAARVRKVIREAQKRQLGEL